MSNRRSFLRFLGFGAVAAPIAASLPVAAEEVSAVRVMAGHRAERYGLARDLLAAQAEINKRRSKMLELLNQGDARLIDERERAEWDQFADGEQWTKAQIAQLRDRRG